MTNNTDTTTASETPQKPIFTTEMVASLNDLFRKTLTLGLGRVILTQGANEHPKRNELINKVQLFNEFTPYNDAFGEHDFGAVRIDGDEFFFKIDYYENKECVYGADPHFQPVYRVLTIMLASEY